MKCVSERLHFKAENCMQQIFNNVPLHTQLAKLHLSSPVSSVPVESMFSSTGLTMNDKLHRIMYIHYNYNFVC